MNGEVGLRKDTEVLLYNCQKCSSLTVVKLTCVYTVTFEEKMECVFV